MIQDSSNFRLIPEEIEDCVSEVLMVRVFGVLAKRDGIWIMVCGAALEAVVDDLRTVFVLLLFAFKSEVPIDERNGKLIADWGLDLLDFCL